METRHWKQGNTKLALFEIRSLQPNFTSQHVAARTGMTAVQASKTCGYLLRLGFLKVAGAVKLSGSKGLPCYLFEPTEKFFELEKKQPSLFAVPTPPGIATLQEHRSKAPKEHNLEEAVTEMRKCLRTVTEQNIALCKIITRAFTTASRVETQLEDAFKIQEALQASLDLWDKK
jgi:hypothetical protein